MVTAEIDGLVTNLSPNRLMSGFYLNELLLKLTERCDPHPEIFFSYAACVQALCDGKFEEPALRCFEKPVADKQAAVLTIGNIADEGVGGHACAVDDRRWGLLWHGLVIG